MAGFFGLFNYNKPGPGVEKGAPKKKRFFEFWSLYFRKFWKLMQANLIYVLVSLPVLSWGLAEVGLAYVTRNFTREKHAFVWSDFFTTIRKNWKQALPVGIVNLLITFLLLFDLYYYGKNTLMMVVMCFIFLVFTFMKFYIPLMIITFRLSWKQLYKNALIFAFVGLLPNLLITLVSSTFYILVVGCVVSVNFPLMALLLVFYVLFFPAFRSFLIQFCIFPLVKKHMIDPYYEAHPGEDAEAKRALNIEDQQAASQPDEEAVFKDMGRTDSYLSEPERPKTALPKQYSEREMRKFRKSLDRARGADDDDDTI